MAETTSNATQECKCASAKKLKSLEKTIVELTSKIEEMQKQIFILRKAVRK